MIVEPDFLDHWKTRLLIQRLNDEAAPLMVLRLWAHCQTRKRWRFEGMTGEAIAALCRSKLDGDNLKGVLEDCGFIETNNGCVTIHDWHVSNRILVSAWKNGRKGGRPTETDRIPTGYPSGNRRQTSPSNHILSSLVESEWLDELGKDAAFEGIDVKHEHAKMIRWCKENKRQPTRRTFINWLNRADRRMKDGTNQRNSTESGRGLGTANEGKSAQYSGVGKVR